MTRKRMELHAGRLMRCYAQRPANVADMLRQSCALAGDAVALIDGEVRLTRTRVKPRRSGRGRKTHSGCPAAVWVEVLKIAPTSKPTLCCAPTDSNCD